MDEPNANNTYNGILFSLKEEILMHPATWMNPEYKKGTRKVLQKPCRRKPLVLLQDLGRGAVRQGYEEETTLGHYKELCK